MLPFQEKPKTRFHFLFYAPYPRVQNEIQLSDNINEKQQVRMSFLYQLSMKVAGCKLRFHTTISKHGKLKPAESP